MHKQPVEVSVIVPTFNRGSLLKENAQALLAQDYTSYELIYVDDGSTDDSLETLRILREENPSRFRVVEQRNSGPGPARNAGAQLAEGKLLLFTDDDTVPPGHWISGMVSLFEAAQCSALSGGFTPYALERPIERYLHRRMSIRFGSRAMTIPAAPMMNFIMARKTFEEVGGFSPERLPALEDWDFCHKLRDAGHTIRYDPAVSVLHRYQREWAPAAERMRATGALGIHVARGRHNLALYSLYALLRASTAPIWIARYYPRDLWWLAWRMEGVFVASRLSACIKSLLGQPVYPTLKT